MLIIVFYAECHVNYASCMLNVMYTECHACCGVLCIMSAMHAAECGVYCVSCTLTVMYDECYV